MQLRAEEPHGRPGVLIDAAVRSQLERILASELFVRSARLSAFLRFVTEQTIDGHGSMLKEHFLGSQLYGKGPEFDGAADPIVRVDARRLRDKLREYYAEFPLDPIVISLAKGSYVPVFTDTRIASIPGVKDTQQVSQQSGKVARRSRWRWAAVVTGLSAVLGSWLAWSVLRKTPQAQRLIRVTTFQGNKVAPGLSPDGRFLAFSSKGPEDSGKADIWVKAIDSEALWQLTATPDFTETSPAWSPEGREIAFVRAGQGVFIVPQSGGVERWVCTSGTWVEWAPDGRSVLIRDREGDAPYGIYQIFLDGLERRRLTQPRLGDGDWRFSVSPDGARLAFIRYEPGAGDVYVVSMQGGEPRRITNWNNTPEHVVWSPDGRDLIYSKSDGLWRIPADVAQPGRGSRLPGVSVPATNLSISRPAPGQRARLVFQSPSRDLSFRIIDLTVPLHEGVFRSVKPFPASTHLEFPGPFSPDSRKFTFVSGRPPQLWISATDGTGLHQITHVSVSELSPGSWSADGRKIVYHASVNGNTDVFIVDASGGTPKRLTFETGVDGTPSWSRDGRWIYIASTRAGATPDIWRVPVGGGSAVRITYHGGLRPFESPDGEYLYYVDRVAPAELTRPTGTAKLMRVPVGGGPETPVLDGLTPFWWSMADSGIFFLSREPEFDAIDHYAFSDRKVVRVGQLAMRAGGFGGQMSVSPDGRWALVTEHRAQADLMLLDNFR